MECQTTTKGNSTLLNFISFIVVVKSEVKDTQKSQMNRWVRSFSFPGSTPVCDVFFSQDERVQIITHFRPGRKNRHTPGSTQGS